MGEDDKRDWHSQWGAGGVIVALLAAYSAIPILGLIDEEILHTYWLANHLSSSARDVLGVIYWPFVKVMEMLGR